MERMNKILWFVPIIVGVGVFLLLKTKIEPWVVETVCRELVRCGG